MPEKKESMEETQPAIAEQVRKVIVLLNTALEIEAQIIGPPPPTETRDCPIPIELPLDIIERDLADALHKAHSIVGQLNRIAERLGK